jgi:hypothetical protein
MVKQRSNFMSENIEKKKSVTFMMKPTLKKEIDLLAVERGNRPCDTLEYLVSLGLDRLAEIGQYGASDGRSPQLAETSAKYETTSKEAQL